METQLMYLICMLPLGEERKGAQKFTYVENQTYYSLCRYYNFLVYNSFLYLIYRKCLTLWKNIIVRHDFYWFFKNMNIVVKYKKTFLPFSLSYPILSFMCQGSNSLLFLLQTICNMHDLYENTVETHFFFIEKPFGIILIYYVDYSCYWCYHYILSIFSNIPNYTSSFNTKQLKALLRPGLW